MVTALGFFSELGTLGYAGRLITPDEGLYEVEPTFTDVTVPVLSKPGFASRVSSLLFTPLSSYTLFVELIVIFPLESEVTLVAPSPLIKN